MKQLLSALRRHPLLLGFMLMFALTWPADLAFAAQSRGLINVPGLATLSLFVGYGFVVAALLASAISGGWAEVRILLRRFLIWRVDIAWYGVALLVPPLAVLLAISLCVLLGGPAPDFAHPFARQLLPPGISLWLLAPSWMLFDFLTNGEEIGWRGYALPRLLERHSALTASLIVGLIWATWHAPKFLMGGVVGGTHATPLWLFTLGILARAIMQTWLYNHTRGSLLVATLFHAGGNTAWACLPISAGGPVEAWALGIESALAVAVMLVTGPGLGRPSPTVRVEGSTIGA